MYGFGQFAYNPNGMPDMQNRLGQQYPQQYGRPMAGTNYLSGRIVTGIEEARASQIPLDGTISYFPSPAENVIYAKSIDMNGLPVFLTYELKMSVNSNLSPQIAENQQITDLKCRIDALEQKIKELTNHESTTNANANNAQQ